METWVESERRYTGSVISLRVGTVRLDDGSLAEREMVEHPGGVAIVSVKGDRVLLIKQFRIAVGREVVELPAGRVEDGESPEYCARRELEEELGYRAGGLLHLASYYASVGFTDERMDIFLALDLEETEKKPEWDERIEAIEIPLDEVETRLESGEFDDSKTIIGLYRLLSYLREHPQSSAE